VVFTAVLSTALVALNGVVDIPNVTLGLFEAPRMSASLMGIPLWYSVVPSLFASLALLVSTGLDWDGTDGSPSRRSRGPQGTAAPSVRPPVVLAGSHAIRRN